jgi:hypothetical protein
MTVPEITPEVLSFSFFGRGPADSFHFRPPTPPFAWSVMEYMEPISAGVRLDVVT